MLFSTKYFDLKFMWENEGYWITKTILKNTNIRKLPLSDFKVTKNLQKSKEWY
jgi:hypothetical protein